MSERRDNSFCRRRDEAKQRSVADTARYGSPQRRSLSEYDLENGAEDSRSGEARYNQAAAALLGTLPDFGKRTA